MIVQELIDILKQYDGNMPVYCYNVDYDNCETPCVGECETYDWGGFGVNFKNYEAFWEFESKEGITEEETPKPRKSVVIRF